MGWRFRKYINVLPGIRINVSKSGLSTTIGPKGANINIGSNGAYLNTGIPGTGLYNRQKILNNIPPRNPSNSDHIRNLSSNNMLSNKNKSKKNSYIMAFFAMLALGGIVIVGFPFLELPNILIPFNTQIYIVLSSTPFIIALVFFDKYRKCFVVQPKEESTDNQKETESVNEETKEDSVDLLEQVSGSLRDSKHNTSSSLQSHEISLTKQEEITKQSICDTDPLLENCANFIVASQNISPTIIENHYGINYYRTLRILDQLQTIGVIAPVTDEKTLTVLVKNEEELKEILFKNIKGHGSIIESIDNVGDKDWMFEECAKLVVSSQQGSTSMLQRNFSIGYNRAGKIMDQLHKAGIVGVQVGAKPREVLIRNLNILDMLLRRDTSFDERDISQSDQTARRDVSNRTLQKLNSLIGLENVKREINNLSNLIKIQGLRKSRGMKTTEMSYHCVFTGNPGTGKTTVARIVAEIYKQLGVLSKGQLVETDRSGLVAEYVGQTAPKTNKIIDSALDGVLFIDEAYSLVQGGQEDFGKEAISTLLKRMEDDRARLVVILAGYTKEMEDFINSNSGLQSRFNRYIEFPDYTNDELLDIFKSIVKKNDFHITEEALEKVSFEINRVVANKDPRFGNARYIRNLFEKIIIQQANRLSEITEVSNDLLTMIEADDVIRAINN